MKAASTTQVSQIKLDRPARLAEFGQLIVISVPGLK
jgi:hypothetical protein